MGQPREIIDFNFRLIPSGEEIDFPANINTIGSRYGPSWQDFQEIGRADPKVLMGSFSKDVDIDFTVVATGYDGHKVLDIFDKLETLSKGARPNYFSGNKGYQGSFIEFTVGRIFIEEIGFITQLQYQWENDKTSFIENLPILARANMTLRWVGRKMPQVASSIYSHRT